MSVSAAIARRPILAVLAALWLLVVAGLVVVVPQALNAYTVTTVLQFSTILALVALGQSLVILCGGAGIDLSVGGVVSLTAVFAALAGKAVVRNGRGIAPNWPRPHPIIQAGALPVAAPPVMATASPE